MKKIILSLFLLFATMTCIASDVYTETDSQGNVVFSDTPLSDHSKKMTESEIQQSSTTVKSNQESQPIADPNPAEEKLNTNKQPYTEFVIASPVDQQTIQNQPTISVSIKLTPALQEGDKIQVFLDGRPWGAANATTSFQFPQPDRGIHTISAKLIDSNQLVLNQTKTITVYIHQTHISTPPPAPAPAPLKSG